MSEYTDNLMKQLHFISEASNSFMRQKKQKFTGQQRVLAILGEEDGMIQSYLAEVLDLRPSSLAELLKKMEGSGDIIRRESENDKRIKRVYLTDAGRKKVNENADLKETDYSETFFAGLSGEEQEAFSGYLRKIAGGWDAEFKNQSKRFVDPMDRLRALQEMRRVYMERFDAGRRDPSPEELREMRRKMAEMMREAHRAGEQWMHEFLPHFFEGFGHDFCHGFMSDEECSPRRPHAGGKTGQDPTNTP